MLDPFVALKVIDAQGCIAVKYARKEDANNEHSIDASSIGLACTAKSGGTLRISPESWHFDPILGVDSVFCFVEAEEKCWRSRMVDEEKLLPQGSLWGPEPEFFLLPNNDLTPKPLTYSPENKSYCAPVSTEDASHRINDVRYIYGALYDISSVDDVFRSIVSNVEKTNFIKVISFHHEVSDFQFEITWQHDSMLATADKFVLFQYIVQETARLHKYHARFDPKPFEGVNGNGCHVHQSLPIFNHDTNVELYAKYLCLNVDTLLPICCPHPESHKRFGHGFEAPDPNNPKWGIEDRTAVVRIPTSINRVEFRLPDPTMNPYEAFPAMLRAGSSAL